MYSNQRKNNPMMMRGKNATIAAVIVMIMALIGFIICISGSLT